MNRLLIIALVIAATAAACTGPHVGGLLAIVALAVVLLTAATAFAQPSDDSADEATSAQDAYADGPEPIPVGPCLSPIPPESSDSRQSDHPSVFDDKEEDDDGEDVEDKDTDDNASDAPDDESDDDPEDEGDDDENGDDNDNGDDTDSSDTTYDFDDDEMRVCLSIAPDDGRFRILRPRDWKGPWSHADDSPDDGATDDRRDILDRFSDRLPDDVLARLDDDQ